MVDVVDVLGVLAVGERRVEDYYTASRCMMHDEADLGPDGAARYSSLHASGRSFTSFRTGITGAGGAIGTVEHMTCCCQCGASHGRGTEDNTPRICEQGIVTGVW